MWRKLSFIAVLVIMLSSAYAKQCMPKDCLDIQQSYKLYHSYSCSEVYTIKPDSLPPFKVYCDMETDGGGWTVFQRRMDGSQDFYLYWKNYQKGFGKLEEEFWLGLDYLQRLTVNKTELRVDFEDFDGIKKYAKYNTFHVGNAVTKYNLTISGYSGNAGDSLSFHNGMKFSTRDSDNDAKSTEHCAVSYSGAMWYNQCHATNFNGLYLYGQNNQYAKGVTWAAYKGQYYSLKTFEMKIRRVTT